MTAKKSGLLGMPFGTAAGRLRKAIMFELARQLGLLSCHRCGEEIAHVDHLSIEHKESWERAADPVQAFFDLGNIAFSHLACNVGAAHKGNKAFPDQQARKRDGFRRYYADPEKRARFLAGKRARHRKKKARGTVD